MNKANVDPRELYPKPPYSDDKQSPPGVTGLMRPRPDHGEETYHGNGLLEGKRALITGADSGIGRAVAIAFAREGADVAISFLSEVQDAEETPRIVTRSLASYAIKSGVRVNAVAPVFVFLASHLASHVTGEVYGVTGGQMPL